MEKLYTCADLAERYGVKIITVWDWIRKNRIKAFKIGKEYRIKESAIIAFENATERSIK